MIPIKWIFGLIKSHLVEGGDRCGGLDWRSLGQFNEEAGGKRGQANKIISLLLKLKGGDENRLDALFGGGEAEGVFI